MWRRAMLYLGLGPDEEYDDYEVADERPAPQPEPASAARARPASSPTRASSGGRAAAPQRGPAERPSDPESSAVRTLPPKSSERPPERATAGAGPGAAAKPRPSVVRPVTAAPTR